MFTSEFTSFSCNSNNYHFCFVVTNGNGITRDCCWNWKF